MPNRHPYLVNKTFKSYLFATVLTSMALSLCVVINGVIVGNLLGTDALSAVNLSAPVMQLCTTFFLWINVGGAILMTIAMGRQKIEEVNQIFSLSMVLNVVFALVIVLVGLFFLDETVHLLCTNPSLQPLVKEYVGIILLTAPVYIILPGLCVYVCTDSNPKLALLALITANVVNIGLNILFILVFSWGIRSASIATAIGFGVGIVIAATHFFKKERMIHFGKLALRHHTGRILLMGLPFALASVLLTVRLLSVNNIILHTLGVSGITVFAVCLNLLMISSLFISGMVQTMQPVASVLYGTEDFKGVRVTIKAAIKTLSICLLSFGVLLMFFPGFVASLFGLSDTAILTQARFAIRIFAFCIPVFGLNYLIMTVFQLSGRHNFSIIVSCLQALMVIPVMLAATLVNNEGLIWFSFVIGEILVFGIIVIISQNIRRNQSYLSPITLINTAQQDESVLDFSIQGDTNQLEKFSSTINTFLLEKNMSQRCKNAIEMCGEELIINIMQHGFLNKKTHCIAVRLRLLSDKALLCITNDGVAFDPVKYNPAGLGLLLVRKLCTNIQYARSLNQNVVVVECHYYSVTYKL